MLPQRVTIGTVEEIQKTTKTINLERAWGRGRIKCPGNAPALLYQSNNSSNDLCYLLSLALPPQDVSVQHIQLSVNLSKDKEQPMLFNMACNRIALALVYMAPFSIFRVIYFKNKDWLVVMLLQESHHPECNSPSVGR